MGDKAVDELARQLEEPRALYMLAEWIAIDKGLTRLEAERYLGEAQELYDYLTLIGFRLAGPLCEDIQQPSLTEEI